MKNGGTLFGVPSFCLDAYSLKMKMQYDKIKKRGENNGKA